MALLLYSLIKTSTQIFVILCVFFFTTSDNPFFLDYVIPWFVRLYEDVIQELPAKSWLQRSRLKVWTDDGGHRTAKVCNFWQGWYTVKILKFGTPQTIAIIVLKIEKLAVTLH